MTGAPALGLGVLVGNVALRAHTHTPLCLAAVASVPCSWHHEQAYRIVQQACGCICHSPGFCITPQMMLHGFSVYMATAMATGQPGLQPQHWC